jgi:hypothetical protein
MEEGGKEKNGKGRGRRRWAPGPLAARCSSFVSFVFGGSGVREEKGSRPRQAQTDLTLFYTC